MKILILIGSLTLIGCTDNPVAHSSKWKKMESSKHATSQFSGKARSNIHSQIITKFQKNGELVLSGTISPQVDIESAEVEWKIPAHVKIISGHEKESIQIEFGKTNNRTVTIDPKTLKPDDRIFFFVYQMKEGVREGSSAQYHHQPQQSEVKDKKLRFKQFSEEKKRKIIE